MTRTWKGAGKVKIETSVAAIERLNGCAWRCRSFKIKCRPRGTHRKPDCRSDGDTREHEDHGHADGASYAKPPPPGKTDGEGNGRGELQQQREPGEDDHDGSIL